MGRISFAGLVATLALTGCGGEGDVVGEPTGESRVVDLAEQSGSGQSGTATLTPVGEFTRVVIALRSSRDEPQPAHIHAGCCERLGEIEFALADVERGSSETTVEASLSFLSGATDAAFAIDVHESASKSDEVACGTLSSGLPELTP